MINHLKTRKIDEQFFTTKSDFSFDELAKSEITCKKKNNDIEFIIRTKNNLKNIYGKFSDLNLQFTLKKYESF